MATSSVSRAAYWIGLGVGVSLVVAGESAIRRFGSGGGLSLVAELGLMAFALFSTTPSYKHRWCRVALTTY